MLGAVHFLRAWGGDYEGAAYFWQVANEGAIYFWRQFFKARETH